MQYVYRISDGRYCGCTNNGANYPAEFGVTDIAPPEDYDELQNESPYFVDGAWEIRNAS